MELDSSLKETNSYAYGKQEVEKMLALNYQDLNYVCLRIPYIIGLDDYTKRFEFYIKNIIKQEAMNIDNLDNQ
ncbi:MAG: hypothetical protein ACRCTA_06575, partial [Bacilli bacterium]